jgi:hypothetical protein
MGRVEYLELNRVQFSLGNLNLIGNNLWKHHYEKNPQDQRPAKTRIHFMLTMLQRDRGRGTKKKETYIQKRRQKSETREKEQTGITFDHT